MFKNNAQFRIIGNAVIAVVMVICITVAAVYFGRISVLWFLLLPFFVALLNDEPKNNKKE